MIGEFLVDVGTHVTDADTAHGVQVVATLLAELRWIIRDIESHYGEDGEEAQILRPLTAALDWFAGAEREALNADGAPRRASTARPYTAVSVFPCCLREVGTRA
jgi:hypothetical protein